MELGDWIGEALAFRPVSTERFWSGVRYFGFQFEREGKTRFGWMAFSQATPTSAIFLDAIAFETVPEVGVRAGM